jgi:hypothetical protein
MVFDACTHAVFSTSGIFYRCSDSALSSVGFCDGVEVGTPSFDAVWGVGDGGDRKIGVDSRCAGGGGALRCDAGSVASVASDAKNARTRCCTRSRFRVLCV